MTLAKRDWVPSICETRVQDIASETAAAASADVLARIQALAEKNRDIGGGGGGGGGAATNVNLSSRFRW